MSAVRPGPWPQTYRRAVSLRTQLDADEAPAATIAPPKEIEGVGTIVDNAKTEIAVGERASRSERQVGELLWRNRTPMRRDCLPNSKTFDFFQKANRSEAISNKTLNTLSVSYIRDPQQIYNKLIRYIDDAVNYEPYKAPDLDPALIGEDHSAGNPGIHLADTVALSHASAHLRQRKWRFDHDHQDPRIKSHKILPFTQWTDINRTDRFICLQTYVRLSA